MPQPTRRPSVRTIDTPVSAATQPFGMPTPIKRAIAFLFQPLAFVIEFVVLSAVIYYFFGVSTVTATLDGKPVRAQVWINGDYVGDTPYEARLGFDATKLEVLAPESSDAAEESWTWKKPSGLYNIGTNIEAEFTSFN